ncbi:MAG: P-II family nitrogen regulator [Lachnospiraceae bacterium]|nr:P-II family nitrogen regulator [Lachnospiraceae bacterium]
MKELEIVIRPEKLEDIKTILDEVNCGGMTLSTVMGCGTQKGISAEGESITEFKGLKTTINLLPKVKVEVVVENTNVEEIIEKVREVCATDHVGDGKIFIKDVEEVVRIRTGERGLKAL